LVPPTRSEVAQPSRHIKDDRGKLGDVDDLALMALVIRQAHQFSNLPIFLLSPVHPTPG
jgi:hypothetical protein